MKFYIPKSNLTTGPNIKATNGIDCSLSTTKLDMTSVTLDISEEENPVGCKNRDCIIYHCKIPRFWQANDAKSISLTSQFHSLVARNDTNQFFSIYSMVQMDEKEPKIAMTKMTSIELGATARLKEIWPSILGVCLGLIFVIVILLILWKTGILAKMRPYRLDKEVIETERKKSEMRLSMRYSKIQKND